MRYALIALLAIPAAASGQTTQTNCTRDYWGNVNCTSQRQPGINWGIIQPVPNTGQSYQNGYEQGQRLVREQEREQSDRAGRKALEVAQAQTMEAARLLNAGDCAGAERYALTAGNLPLAIKVKEYCQK